MLKVQRQHEDAMKEVNHSMSARMKAGQDVKRIAEERNAAVQVCKLHYFISLYLPSICFLKFKFLCDKPASSLPLVTGSSSRNLLEMILNVTLCKICESL